MQIDILTNRLNANELVSGFKNYCKNDPLYGKIRKIKDDGDIN